MVVHAIASYNLSWMGDQGKMVKYASEKHLFVNQKDIKSREYFHNAISNALHFWNNILDSSAISFQEVNDQDYVKKENPIFNGGFQYIIQIFKENTIKQDLESSYFCVECEISKPCLLILWKKSKFGSKLFEFGDDIVYEVNGNKQIGRPILIVVTTQNYFLINCHGPNHGSESEIGMPKLREAINKMLISAILKFGDHIDVIDPKKVIIMGDFNDGYSSINKNNKLKILDNYYTFGDVAAPKSCCYNFSSSCDTNIFGILNERQQKEYQDLLMYDSSLGDNLYMNANECSIIINDINASRDMRIGIYSLPRSLGERGKIVNYKNSGDYCFTSVYNKILKPLSIYRSINYLDGISRESDHEMVVLIFDDEYKSRIIEKRISRKKKLKKSCKKKFK